MIAYRTLPRLSSYIHKIRPRHVIRMAQQAVLEALEPRQLLTVSPLTMADFIPLGGDPVIVAGPGGLNGTPLLDLNDDGTGDLIIQYNSQSHSGPATADTVSALLVNPDGSAREYKIASYNQPVSQPLPVINQVLTADFNNDGHIDVAVLRNDGGQISNIDYQVDIFLGHADGTFTKPNPSIDLGTSITAPTMYVMDMNGDGKTDVVVQNFSVQFKMTAYLGNGSGGFGGGVLTTYAAGPISGTLDVQDDVNGDGIKDIIMSTLGLNSNNTTLINILSVYLGKSDGHYNLTPSYTNNTDNLTFLGLRQLSSDNKPDIVAYSTAVLTLGQSATVFVFRNNGNGNFTKTFASPILTNGFLSQLSGSASLQPFLTPDLNKDGSNDLILMEGSTAATNMTIHIEKNNGDATFTAGSTIAVTDFGSTSSLQVADVDNDTLPDIFVTQFHSSNALTSGTVYFNQGNATFGTPGVTVNSTVIGGLPRLADFNGDHKLDMLFYGFNSGAGGNALQVMLNTTGQTFGAAVQTVLSGLTLLVQPFQNIPSDPLLDYTGDSLPDLLAYSNNGPTTGVSLGFIILASDGTGGFTQQDPSLAFGGSVKVDETPIAGDFNHDGKTDLMFPSSAAGFAADIGGLYILINGVSQPVDTAGADNATARDLGTISNPIALTEYVDTAVGADARDSFDFYKFTISDATPAVRFIATPDAGNVNFFLTGPGILGVGDAFGSGLSPTVEDDVLTPGTYVLQVSKGGGANTHYRLDFVFPGVDPAIGILQGLTQLASGQATPLDFGDVLLTTTDTSRTFRVRNDGQTSLNLGNIVLPTGFSMGADTLVSTLDAGESDTFTVFMKTDVTGTFSGNIIIPSTDLLTSSFQIPVTGTVSDIPVTVNTPLIAVSQGGSPITSGQGTAVVFGPAPQNDNPAPQLVFTVANTGTAALTTSNLHLPAGYSLVDGLSPSIPANQSDTFTVKLNDNATGSFSGNITFINNSGGVSNTFTIPVTGTVNAIPVVPPDLSGAVQSVVFNHHEVTSADLAIPGDSVTVTLRVFENAAVDFKASNVDITFYASQNQTLDGSATRIQIFTEKTLKIAATKFVDLKFTLTVPENLDAGDYFILADIDSGHTVTETNENNNATSSAVALPVVLEAGQLGARKNLKLTVQEADGTFVTFAPSGPGTLQVVPGSGFYDLNITGADAKSSITITTKKSKLVGDDGLTVIHDVTFDAPANLQPFALSASLATPSTAISKFTAKTASLTGTFSAPLGLKSLTLASATGATIDIGPSAKAADTTTLAIGRIKDTSIASQMGIKSLTALEWLDTDLTPDTLIAPILGTLNITGSKPLLLNGDFEADVTLAGQLGAKAAMASGKIAGSLTDAIWDITGALPSLTVGKNTDTFSLTTHAGSLKTTKLGSVTAATLVIDGDGGAITATQWLAGAITAKTAKSLAVTGNKKAAIQGDLQANLTLTGDPNAKSVLGSLSVAGVVKNATIHVSGNTGSITVGGTDTANFLIGVKSGVVGLPAAVGDFDPFTLAGFKTTGVTGLANAFINSNIAAKTIGNVSLLNVLTTNNSTDFGIIADKLTAYARKSAGGTVKLSKLDDPTVLVPVQGEADRLNQFRIHIL